MFLKTFPLEVMQKSVVPTLYFDTALVVHFVCVDNYETSQPSFNKFNNHN